MDLAELVVRERVRDIYATYTHAGDRYRLAQLAGCFPEDGTLEIKGGSSASGREAIVAMLSGAEIPAGQRPPRPMVAFVRHVVTNLLFTSLSARRVESTAYFCVLTDAGPDHWVRYCDVLVPVGDHWLFAHRQVSVDAAVPGGWYAHA